MSNFYVTAIRESDNSSSITHVLVHSPASNGRLKKGVIFSRNEIITSMGLGNTFKTATYNYNRGSWSEGANIGTVRVGLTIYLRTDRDSTARDNLGNLLLIDELR